MENLCALRAESNAYTEFVCALGNEITENTVEPGSGEDQCDDSESQDEKRVEFGAERGLSDGFTKSLHVGDSRIAIHGVDYTLNGMESASTLRVERTKRVAELRSLPKMGM